MKNRSIILSILILSLGFTYSYGQCDCSYKQMVQKIDSVAKAAKIVNGKVYYHQVTSTFDKTSTGSHPLTGKEVFSFDGMFLVIEEHYFNLDKLLYFTVEVDHIEFFFQGY